MYTAEQLWIPEQQLLPLTPKFQMAPIRTVVIFYFSRILVCLVGRHYRNSDEKYSKIKILVIISKYNTALYL